MKNLLIFFSGVFLGTMFGFIIAAILGSMHRPPDQEATPAWPEMGEHWGHLGPNDEGYHRECARQSWHEKKPKKQV